MPNSTENNPEESSSSGILDTVMETEHAHALADFNPEKSVFELLKNLRDRDREVISLRYGLEDSNQHTLEAIGKRLGLTRERVRQIEKEGIRQLRSSDHPALNEPLDIIKKTVNDHGGIFAHHALISHLLITDRTVRRINSLAFILELSDSFRRFDETEDFHHSWHTDEFQPERLEVFHKATTDFLESHGQPIDLQLLMQKLSEHESIKQHDGYFSEKVIENLLKITKRVRSNPFGEYGLHHWRVIQPKDVGDKAYLVLKHQKQPLHYSQITELINQHQFDERTAYKETVHNELIMDERFVLVGRGIYALVEWGYKKGLVSDIIKEILSESPEPLERNQIVDAVLKHRMVRRNTILVGLANRKLFKKIGKSKYTLV